MQSKVTHLYDFTQAQIPEELRLWRVSDAELDAKLQELSGTYAQETEVSEAQAGDTVVCRSESAAARWNKPVLLLYPGHHLIDAALEDAVLGLHPGDAAAATLPDGALTLTVQRIVRRMPHPITDVLIQQEHIEGVDTVEGYRRWYRETTEARNRMNSQSHLAVHLLEQIVARSTFSIDPEEESHWARTLTDIEYQNAVANGMDPTVPENGTDFLTEEQAREQMYQKILPLFRREVVYPAIAVQLSGMPEEDFFQAELEHIARRYYNQTGAELRDKTPEWALRGQVFQTGALRLLKEYSATLLEV